MENLTNDKKELQFFKISTISLIFVFVVLSFLAYLKREFLKRMYLRHKRFDEIKKCKELIVKSEDKEEKSALQYKIARIYHTSLGDHSQAILEYKNFINEYSDSILVENVIYYMARCWEFLGNFSRAKVEYKNLISQFPNGTRENDAKFRIEDIDTIVDGVNLK
jgi:tetratricopeptide (TPR) repeat protein